MAGTDDGPTGIIARLHLQGTLFERLIREPEGWAHPECFADSPGLMRFAMDVRRALSTEGWEPPSRARSKTGLVSEL